MFSIACVYACSYICTYELYTRTYVLTLSLSNCNHPLPLISNTSSLVHICTCTNECVCIRTVHCCYVISDPNIPTPPHAHIHTYIYVHVHVYVRTLLTCDFAPPTPSWDSTGLLFRTMWQAQCYGLRTTWSKLRGLV